VGLLLEAAHEEAAAPTLGLGNAALKKGEGQDKAKWGGGHKRVWRERVRERGESHGMDTLGGIRSKICRLGTLG
jgi:hypothetical protein